MDIYSKIDKMFQKDISEDVLNEIKDLKEYVKKSISNPNLTSNTSTIKENKVKSKIEKVEPLEKRIEKLNEQLKSNTISTQKNLKKELPKEYYNFVRNFKQKYKAKPRYNFYVEFKYQGRILSLNENGLLCEKGRVLSKYQAFKIFEYLYEHKFEIIEEKEEVF